MQTAFEGAAMKPLTEHEEANLRKQHYPYVLSPVLDRRARCHHCRELWGEHGCLGIRLLDIIRALKPEQGALPLHAS